MQSKVTAGRWGALITGAGLYGVALILMALTTPSGVTRESIAIALPDGRPSLGTIWRPAGEPKAVMIMGHGVTSNQGVMATVAKAFAANGYETITLDFFGHGRSREPFDWTATPSQVTAWIEWAETEYAGMPLAYLGHSMGGFAGSSALSEMDNEVAFVSLGAMPRGDNWPSGPILIALGQFEQLFSPEQARARAEQAPEGNASVLVSPWSDHALETWDPILIGGMVDWVDGALGLPQDSAFPWGRWLLLMLALPLGIGAILVVATTLTAQIREPLSDAPTRTERRSWSVNPYRLTARLLGQRGVASRPVAGGIGAALRRGLLFAFLCVLLLSFLLSTDMFTSGLDHPQRLVRWLLLAIIGALVFLLDAHAIESVPHSSHWRRFAVTALTRVVPILAFAIVLYLPVVGMAFGGMMVGIFAFLGLMLAIVHTLATRATNDYRAAAIASAVIFTWVIAFWFPLAG